MNIFFPNMFAIWWVYSCTLSGFKTLVSEMFTNHKVHAENHALEPYISSCYGWLEQQENPC